MKTLEQSVKKLLKKEIKQTFCKCGSRQCHNLIYCRLCGEKFSNGYKPKTQGDTLIYLNSKPHKAWSVEYWAAIFKTRLSEETGRKLTYQEIAAKAKKQLKTKYINAKDVIKGIF